MFWFGQKRKLEDLEQMTGSWMAVSMLIVDKDDVKRSDEKFRIALAYFYGTSRLLGQNVGISIEYIQMVFLKCAKTQFGLSRSDLIRACDALIDVVSDNAKYGSIMQTGVEAFQRWLQTKGRDAPVVLIAVLGGR